VNRLKSAVDVDDPALGNPGKTLTPALGQLNVALEGSFLTGTMNQVVNRHRERSLLEFRHSFSLGSRLTLRFRRFAHAGVPET